MATTQLQPPQSKTFFARIRIATKSDVPQLHKLMHQMAVFHNATHLFTADQDAVSVTLFDSNNIPFKSPTAFILEVSSNSFHLIPSTIDADTPATFNPILKEFNLDLPIVEPEPELFTSSVGGDHVFAAGYVLFFPNYSGFFAKPGIYMDHLYLRECYRGKGFGKMLFSAVASQAMKMGYGIDWICAEWNKNTIQFYVEMGAEVMQEWRLCRLSGQALQSYAAK